ncbi:hypothetical protein BGZ76_001288, partial [Entomortierella beljakovae]
MSSQASLASRALPRLGVVGRQLSSNIKRSISARRQLSSSPALMGETYFPRSAPTIQQSHIPSSGLKQQQYQKHTNSMNPYKSIAIRREGKNRWERRAALTPDAVEKLIKETGIKVYVQPSTKRIFTDDKYRAAGATIQEDLSSADVILGIKEVPVKDLIPGKTYVYFSHTHKGQKYNMPMLQDVLDK